MMEVNLVRFTVVMCVFMAACFSYAVGIELEVVKQLKRLNKPAMKSINSPDGDIIDSYIFEVVKHLNCLNKPAMKSIKSPDGDIIDCVHISHQSAFDHPSLKNHEIQMRPNYHPEGMNYESMKLSSENHETITQLWHLNGECEEGTIPIRRTKKEDIMRANSIKNYGKKNSISTVAHPNSVDLDRINQSGH